MAAREWILGRNASLALRQFGLADDAPRGTALQR